MMHMQLKKIAGDSNFYSDDEDGIIVGEGLAESLNSEVGDTLTLLASNDDGVMNAATPLPCSADTSREIPYVTAILDAIAQDPELDERSRPRRCLRLPGR